MTVEGKENLISKFLNSNPNPNPNERNPNPNERNPNPNPNPKSHQKSTTETTISRLYVSVPQNNRQVFVENDYILTKTYSTLSTTTIKTSLEKGIECEIVESAWRLDYQKYLKSRIQKDEYEAQKDEYEALFKRVEAIRFLTARNWDLEKALELYRKTMKWRAFIKIDSILSDFTYNESGQVNNSDFTYNESGQVNNN